MIKSSFAQVALDHTIHMACEISFDPGNTPSHNLPPWELAKTYAFHVAIEKLVEVTGMSAVDVLGNKTNDFIAEQVLNASGEHPTERAVRAAVARCKQPEWFPGKPRDSGAGRKPTYSQHVKNKVADRSEEHTLNSSHL